MKKFIIALAASTAIISGAAYAQQGSPTATESESDATTAQPGGETTGGAMAPEAGGGAEAPTATEAESNATTVPAADAAPEPGATDAPAVAGEAPTDTEAESDATTVDVGGAPMYSDRTIAENAPNASNLSTLVAAVTAADLVETLGGEGPFTVFAPDNAAFEALPAGTVDTLLEEENADQLTSILTYHVVPAEATSEAAMQMIEDDGGTHEVTTVQGGTLTLAMDGDNLTVTDEQGNVATVTQADVMQSNGVVHVIDTVLMPAS